MTSQSVKRMRAHRNNIRRYRRLLTTRLMDHERFYIERRLNEERALLKAVLRESLPERICASGRSVGGGPRTCISIDRFLDPAGAFSQPMDVVEDCDLTPYEKRAILSAWAIQACDFEEAGRLPRNGGSFDEIVDALNALGKREHDLFSGYVSHGSGAPGSEASSMP